MELLLFALLIPIISLLKVLQRLSAFLSFSLSLSSLLEKPSLRQKSFHRLLLPGLRDVLIASPSYCKWLGLSAAQSLVEDDTLAFRTPSYGNNLSHCTNKWPKSFIVQLSLLYTSKVLLCLRPHYFSLLRHFISMISPLSTPPPPTTKPNKNILRSVVLNLWAETHMGSNDFSQGHLQLLKNTDIYKKPIFCNGTL